jgi:hypothetical protein
MVVRNIHDGNNGVPVWDQSDKRAAAQLQRDGLVTVERTDATLAGVVEWRVRLATRPDTGRVESGIRTLAAIKEARNARASGCGALHACENAAILFGLDADEFAALLRAEGSPEALAS